MDFLRKIEIPPTIQIWCEAIRFRTLPASMGGVLAAWAVAVHCGKIRWLPALICLFFALLCQIASNFANEYYDYRDGMDKPGRSGPRRGVTEGDIRPSDMKMAAFITLFVAMMLGLWLIFWSGPWLIIPGVIIAVGALAYSAGPYPLSRNGLGEAAVMLFFGIIPVNFTYYLAVGSWNWRALPISIAVGLMAANILIVNNYRDAEEDRLVGKRTLANILGRDKVRTLYLLNGVVAFLLSLIAAIGAGGMWVAPIIYLFFHIVVWTQIDLKPGDNPSRLNPYLGTTGCLLLLYAFLLFI